MIDNEKPLSKKSFKNANDQTSDKTRAKILIQSKINLHVMLNRTYWDA